jgi:hypothetical protein
MTRALTLFLAFLICNSQSFGGKIRLNSADKLHISISIVKPSYRLSAEDKQLDLNVRFYNASQDSIGVQEIMEPITSFNAVDAWSRDEALISYKIELYDEKDDFRDTLPNNDILNDIDFVDGGNRYNAIKIMRPGETFEYPINLMSQIYFSRAGRYRVTLYFGIKSSANSFYIIKTNSVYFELIK